MEAVLGPDQQYLQSKCIKFGEEIGEQLRVILRHAEAVTGSCPQHRQPQRLNNPQAHPARFRRQQTLITSKTLSR